jgi:hypothetical protein
MLLVAFIIIVGTVGYALVEGWSVTDALYATIITITTVGYGDMAPTTLGGKIFAIVFTLVAIGAVGYTLSSLAAGLIEKKQNLRKESLRNRQMKRITDLEQHIIICGGGYVGKRIAHELTTEGQDFVVIEEDERIMRWTLLYLDEDYRKHRYRESYDITFLMDDTGHEELDIAHLAHARRSRQSADGIERAWFGQRIEQHEIAYHRQGYRGGKYPKTENGRIGSRFFAQSCGSCTTHCSHAPSTYGRLLAHGHG